MQPPLPEVPLLPVPFENKKPPSLLVSFIWVSALLTLVGWGLRFGKHALLLNLVDAVVIGLASLVWWNLWRGHGWARYITLALCLLNFVASFALTRERSAPQHVTLLIGQILDVLLFIYLLTPAMQRYFSRHEPIAQ